MILEGRNSRITPPLKQGYFGFCNNTQVIISAEEPRECGKLAFLSWAQTCHSLGTHFLVISHISVEKNIVDFSSVDFKVSLYFSQSKYYVFISISVQVAVVNVNSRTSPIAKELCPF